MIITISDFPPTTWNLTSVKHNSDSVKTTSLCSPMFCKYQQIWFLVKELLLVDWKAFVFYLEDWRIYVDTVIYWKDLVDQSPRCLWQVALLWVTFMRTTLKNCFVFIDYTVMPICRPDHNQRVVYSGPKKVHGFKFQSLSLPNEMLANLYGPVGELYRVHKERTWNSFAFDFKLARFLHNLLKLLRA